jgi:hypothetical protein
MAIAFRSAGTAVHTIASSPAVGSEPAGAASGDILVFVGLVDVLSSTGWTAAAGWTILKSGTQVDFRYIIAYIVRGGSAPSYSFPWTGTSRYVEHQVFAFSGGDGAAPIDAQATPATGTTNTGNGPAVVAVSSAAMAVTVLFHWGGSTGGWTAPAGYVLRSDNTNGNDNAVATKLLSASGSEDPAAWDVANAADDWYAHTFTLKPAGATSVTLTPATETDAAQALSLQKFATVTPATETDAGQALLFGKNASVAPATETDSAQGLSFYRAATITPATETDGAQALAFAKNTTLTPAVEVDGAQPLSYYKSVAITAATEVDQAQALGLTFATFYTITPATETDSATFLTLVRNITLTPATETDSAQVLGYSQAGGGGGNGGAVQRVRHAVGVKQPDAQGVTSNL